MPTTASTTNPSQIAPTPEHVDLIRRYNLSGKTGTSSIEEEGEEVKDKSTWSNDRNERQALFQKRREEMILNARRKLVERERKGKGREMGGP